MIEINGPKDLDKYAETRLIKLLHNNPKWRFDHKTEMFVFDNAVIFAFDELGECQLEGYCLLLRLIWTIPSARRKGKTLEALQSLVENCELARCAMIGSVRPYKMRRPVYDIDLALNRLKLNQFKILSVEESQAEIAGMQRLLSRAGFENNIDLHGVISFEDPNFPIDKQFIYTPSTIDESISSYLTFHMPERMNELFEDDLDAA